MHCCCCCCCSWSCCRLSLGHDLAAKKQCPLSVDPGMVTKPAPGNRAGARGFAGRARGPSAPGVRGNGRVMHRRPRRWTPTAFPGVSSPATGRKSHKKAKKFKVIIGSTRLPFGTWFPRARNGWGERKCLFYAVGIVLGHWLMQRSRGYDICLLYTSPSPRD